MFELFWRLAVVIFLCLSATKILWKISTAINFLPIKMIVATATFALLAITIGLISVALFNL